MDYTNLNPAIDALAYALSAQHKAETKVYDEIRTASLEIERAQAFTKGVSFAIGIIYDAPDVVASIERAARERARDAQS